MPGRLRTVVLEVEFTTVHEVGAGVVIGCGGSCVSGVRVVLNWFNAKIDQ